MLKKIHAKQVRLGMHIHELCGPWINHPFWRSKFILTDPADLRRLMESGITELWIDSSKGLDVEAGETREKVDGSGYPHHLKDPEISLFAKMDAACDVYDAITSNHLYKQGWDPAESIKEMTEWSNGHFDQKVFQAFVKRIATYPTGALVRLPSGRLPAGSGGPVASKLSGKIHGQGRCRQMGHQELARTLGGGNLTELST